MKKDKAVRKAEFRAALKRGLKSLIGPLVVLLIILVGVLVVMFYQEEEEPVEIIKVNAYEGAEEEIVLESDRLKFVMDSMTTQFYVEDKKTGTIWYSNPTDSDTDTIAQTAEKGALKSTIVLTYSTINGVDTIYDNYTYSMKNQIYDIEKGDDYVTIYYSIGDTQKEFVIPPVIIEEDMLKFRAEMNPGEASLLDNYYVRYDINNLGKKDNKEELLSYYPIMQDKIIYVLRDTTKDNMRAKFQQMFEAAGYTYENYLADKELDLKVKTSDKPVFNLQMTYRLDGDDLLVEIPKDKMEYRDEYPILYLSVLPYFGAGGKNDEGFLLVPEGGGSIINFNNGKTSQNSYYANLYGWDYATARKAVVHETRAYFNAFGVSKGDSSYLCVIEESAPYAAIQANVSGKVNSYNSVNAQYSIVTREQYDVGTIYNGNMYIYNENPLTGTIKQRYSFIDSDSYVDMASVYEDYLLKKYDGYLTMNEDTSTPVALEVIGAVDKVRQVMGIPVSRPHRLTTYKEAQDIVQELNADGIDNMSVKLTGWMNGGVQQQVLNKVKTISDLGSKKDLKNLVASSNEDGIDFYLNGMTNYAKDSNILDGFLVFTDAARFASNEKADLHEYSTTTFGQATWTDNYYLLKYDLIMDGVDTMYDTAAKYKAGVSFEDIGKDLSSDYKKGGYHDRQDVMEAHAQALKEADDAGAKTMINMGNDYAVPYVDFVTGMDLAGSGYTIIDYEVPFYQLAIHGYVNYTDEPLNLTQNMEEVLLRSAEFGAGLSFTVMEETAFALQKTLYTEYFAADYALWHDKILDIYNKYNEQLGHTFNQKMVNHEVLAEDVTCTTYEDGTKVYVNYREQDYTVKGVKIPARDYVVRK